MLFAVTYANAAHGDEARDRRTNKMLATWKPPAGFEFKCWYDYADGSGGVAIVDTPSAAIEAATHRRAAFLSLARWFESVAATVAAHTDALLFRPPQDAAERLRQLRALDHSTRLHVRLANRLAAISSSPTFREPADALALLRDTYAEQIRQCDFLRTPGHKPRFEWPPTMTELLDLMEDRERKTA